MKRFMKHRLGLLLILLGVAGLFSLTADQAPAQYTQPPRISPWLMLNNSGSGASGLSNYYNFVRPRQEMTQALQSQAAQLQTQGAMLQRTQSATRQIEGQISGDGGALLQKPRSMGPAPRGAAGHRNYAHWYNGLPGDPTPRNNR